MLGYTGQHCGQPCLSKEILNISFGFYSGGQHGEIVGDFGRTDHFPITGGVRQSCVVSPRLFCVVLEIATRKWTHAFGQAGIDFMDGGPNELDLRFADDILILARLRQDLGQLIDSLMIHLEQVGLLLNAERTVVVTNEAQPPQFLATTADCKLQSCSGMSVLHVDSRGDTITTIDFEYHLQQVSIFSANRWILLDRSVSISKRLTYFNAVVSPVASFGSGHRAIYNSQLATLDVQFRFFNSTLLNKKLPKTQASKKIQPYTRDLKCKLYLI